MTPDPATYPGHRFPAEIIGHAVWPYVFCAPSPIRAPKPQFLYPWRKEGEWNARPVRAAMLVGGVLLTAWLGPSAGAEANIGVCRFDAERLSFAGAPTAQARCLLRPVLPAGRLGPELATLPAPLDELVGNPVDITRKALVSHLETRGIGPEEIGGPLSRPVSRAAGTTAGSAAARYFVIHDTSTPNLLTAASFPGEIDSGRWPHNRLERWRRGSASKAHVFVARTGTSLTALDFATPWRATKLENAAGVRSRGLFLHVEMVQPRRSDPGGPPGKNRLAPEPGFTAPQLERLALLYVAVSVRRGEWLIPAFHAAVDGGLLDGHDDPQRFDLGAWARRVAALRAALLRSSS